MGGKREEGPLKRVLTLWQRTEEGKLIHKLIFDIKNKMLARRRDQNELPGLFVGGEQLRGKDSLKRKKNFKKDWQGKTGRTVLTSKPQVVLQFNVRMWP